MHYRKSRYSNPNGECVEVGNCVEVASGVLVRDTKDHGTGPVPNFSAAAWRGFTAACKTL